MYGKYNKKRGFRGKRKVSPTRRAYLAGIKRGKAIARRSKRRWY